MNGVGFEIQCNLGVYRRAKNLSQSDLAALVGVSKNCVSSLECGDWFPSLKLAVKFAYVLDRDVCELFPCFIHRVCDTEFTARFIY